MIVPMRRPLDVWRLDNPWTDSFLVTLDGATFDVSSYSARMQFRVYAGAPDPPLLDVSSLTATAAGSAIDMTAGLAGAITIRLAKSDLLALPTATATGQPYGEPGQPAVLAYDLLLTDSAGAEATWFFGPANIWPGVTQHG